MKRLVVSLVLLTGCAASAPTTDVAGGRENAVAACYQVYIVGAAAQGIGNEPLSVDLLDSLDGVVETMAQALERAAVYARRAAAQDPDWERLGESIQDAVDGLRDDSEGPPRAALDAMGVVAQECAPLESAVSRMADKILRERGLGE